MDVSLAPLGYDPRPYKLLHLRKIFPENGSNHTTVTHPKCNTPLSCTLAILGTTNTCKLRD